MRPTALSSAHTNVCRKLYDLANAWKQEPEAPVDPDAALRLAESLSECACKLALRIGLLRCGEAA
jgi:hypothetical protein